MNTIEALIHPLTLEEEDELRKLLSHPLIVKHLRNVMHTAALDILAQPWDSPATPEGKANTDLNRAYKTGVIESCNTLLQQTR